jgi:hypothetical protein
MRKTLTALSSLVAAHICAADVAFPATLRLNLLSPLDFQVVQRSALANGELIVAGNITGESKTPLLPDKLEVRVTGKSPFANVPDKWQPLPYDSRVPAFRGKLILPAGGWYRLEVLALRQGVQVASAVVEHVGVGEIFAVAGQSNSANYGEERQATKSGLVAAFDGNAWRLANDPQPGAGGTKGSFMPPFGDEMAERFHIPVGLVATGIGSTSVREWLPMGTRLTRLPPLTRNVVTNSEGQWESSGKIFEKFTARLKLLGTNGFRAVLWHQGESDAHQADPERTLPGELYRQYLEQLIRDSRRAIGWDAPWFVAQVSYHNPNDTSSPDIRAAQRAVWDDGVALPGPDTDTLTGDLREKNGTGVHLSAKGLKAHAHLWVEKVSSWLEQQLGRADKQ